MNREHDPLEAKWGPVVGHFTVTRTPAGGATPEVRQLWVGLALPIRHHAQTIHLTRNGPDYFDGLTGEARNNAAPVPIVAEDGIHCLRVAAVADQATGRTVTARQRAEAADYWSGIAEMVGPLLIFHTTEGTIKLDDPYS